MVGFEAFADICRCYEKRNISNPNNQKHLRKSLKQQDQQTAAAAAATNWFPA